MICGMRLWKWILIILVNLLLYMVTCHIHPLSGDIMLTSVKSCYSPMKIPVNISLKFCAKENVNSYRKFVPELPNKNWNRHGLDHLINKTDESDSIVWKSEVADRKLHVKMTTSMLSLIWYRVRRTDRSRFSVSVHVNGGHYKHKFWTCDFLVYFVRFIDTGFCKCERYKHVHSVNIDWNVLLLYMRHLHGTVATKQMCDRKFLHQVLHGIFLRTCAL